MKLHQDREAAANGYAALPRTSGKTREANLKGSITSVYEYDPVTMSRQMTHFNGLDM